MDAESQGFDFVLPRLSAYPSLMSRDISRLCEVLLGPALSGQEPLRKGRCTHKITLN
jgi:hypothetical protein